MAYRLPDEAPPRDIEQFVRGVADYVKISAIFWLVLAIIQICTLVGIIAGLWNLFAAFSRFSCEKQVRARSPGVVAVFEPLTGLVIIGIINLLFGGVIGIIFVIFDYIIREKVLINAHVFGCAPSAAAALNAQPQQAEAPSINSLYEQLEKLGEMKDKGLLTEDEFASMKTKFLSF